MNFMVRYSTTPMNDKSDPNPLFSAEALKNTVSDFTVNYEDIKLPSWKKLTHYCHIHFITLILKVV